MIRPTIPGGMTICKQIATYVENWSSSLKEKMKPEPTKKEDDW